MKDTKNTLDVENYIFLLAGLLFITALYLAKTGDEIQESDNTISSFVERIIPTVPPTVLVSLNGQDIYLTKHPVTNEEFYTFSRATGYRTWRERNRLLPNWRYPFFSEKDNEEETPKTFEDLKLLPVLWLSREDSEAYCQWLKKEYNSLGKNYSFSLPSFKELEAAAIQQEESFDYLTKDHWEWTRSDLSDFGSKLGNASDYLTAWRSGNGQRHRRSSDMGRKDVSATGFRLRISQG
ncbi:MAG: sulfatase activating formylglycine-generating enzyme [Chlamydiales bacterium]|jgi:formylglycine-generating enzyme required for sulfatase activity